MISKNTAAILWANNFKLVDKTGFSVSISGVNEYGLKIVAPKYSPALLKYEEISNNWFILRRPLNQLTETITHEGRSIVPIVELAKQSCLFETFGCEFETEQEYGFDSEVWCNLYNEIETVVIWSLTYNLNHNSFLTDFESTFKGKCDQYSLFNRLHSLHFLPNVPDSLCKDIEI